VPSCVLGANVCPDDRPFVRPLVSPDDRRFLTNIDSSSGCNPNEKRTKKSVRSRAPHIRWSLVAAQQNRAWWFRPSPALIGGPAVIRWLTQSRVSPTRLEGLQSSMRHTSHFLSNVALLFGHVHTVTIRSYGTLANFVAPVPAMHSYGAPLRGVLVSLPFAAILTKKGAAGAHVGLHTTPLFRGRQGRATDKTPYWRPIRQPKRPYDAPSSTLSIRKVIKVAPILCTHMSFSVSRLGACPQPRCTSATCCIM